MIEWLLVNFHNNDLNLKIGLIVWKAQDWRRLSLAEQKRILKNKREKRGPLCITTA